MSFVAHLFSKPIPTAFNGAAALVGFVSYFAFDTEASSLQRILVAISLALACFLTSMTITAYSLYQRANEPVPIRTVLEGTHFYQGRLLVILGKSSWVAPGQLLALIAEIDGITVPIALLSVVGTTTSGYPQCVVCLSFTDQPLSDYLGDKSRWRSLSALPEIKTHYLEASNV